MGAIAQSLTPALHPPPGLALASFTWYPNFECKEQPENTNGAQPTATLCTYIPSSSPHCPESLHPPRSEGTWLSAGVARAGMQLARRRLRRNEPTQAISLCKLLCAPVVCCRGTEGWRSSEEGSQARQALNRLLQQALCCMQLPGLFNFPLLLHSLFPFNFSSSPPVLPHTL